MKSWLIAIVVIVVIAVGVGGFFGGRAMGGGKPTPQEALNVLNSLTPQERQQLFQNGGGFGGLFGGRGNGSTGSTNGSRTGAGFVSGSIIAQDSNSITVKLSDGSTKIVLYSGSTTIGVSQAGTASDLAVGKDVTVTGTTNSDGSVTATRIQIGSLPRVGNGGPGGTGSGGTTPGTSGASTPTTTGPPTS